jgi:hypothetical protein
LVTIARPSPLMLATKLGTTIPPSPGAAGDSTTSTGAGVGDGLASSTARLSAATLANAAKLRQKASCAHQRTAGVGAAAVAFALPEMRASMRCQTCGEGVTGGSEVLKGSSRSCQTLTAVRSAACAGSSASKRRRAGPRSVPST